MKQNETLRCQDDRVARPGGNGIVVSTISCQQYAWKRNMVFMSPGFQLSFGVRRLLLPLLLLLLAAWLLDWLLSSLALTTSPASLRSQWPSHSVVSKRVQRQPAVSPGVNSMPQLGQIDRTSDLLRFGLLGKDPRDDFSWALALALASFSSSNLAHNSFGLIGMGHSDSIELFFGSALNYYQQCDH